MKVGGWRVFAATLVLIAVVALACSKDKSTNPPGTTLTLNSGTLVGGSPGAAYLHTFASAGSFPYHCNFHSDMHGTVTVAAGGADSVVVTIANSTTTGFQPQTVTVKPTGYVRWINVTAQSHTVTSD
jgi:plastocyanin